MERRMSRLDIERIFPYVSALTIQDQTDFLYHLKRTRLPRGSVFFASDSLTASSIYVISGELRYYTISQEGKEITLFRLHGGDYSSFLEVKLLSDQTFSLVLQVERNSEIYSVNHSALRRICENCPEAKRFEADAFIERSAAIICSLQYMLSLGSHKRLAKFLIEEVERSGCTEITYTQDQIGRYVGSPREMVTRAVNDFARDGIVRISRGRINVLNMDALREIMQQY